MNPVQMTNCPKCGAARVTVPKPWPETGKWLLCGPCYSLTDLELNAED